MKLLHIDASILGHNSVSRQLSTTIVERMRSVHPALQVRYIDLAREPLDHLTAAHLAARAGTPDATTVSADLRRDRQVLEDFLAADIIVIGAPMYNFSIPSQLKAWIDRIAVAGETFRYTENGAEGLAGAKKVIVASTRGGYYGGQSPAVRLDHQEQYLRALFGFLGITDLTFVRAEGLNIGPEQRAAGIAAATAQAAQLSG
jgi:FMN-dependent NADH-azoreductase